MAPEQAKSFMREAAGISLDGQTSGSTEEASSKKVSNLPTRRDFYDMDDEEIERHLGKADNPEGSFEKLLGGFRNR